MQDVYYLLAAIKPSFKDDPTNGPYNHGYIIGTENLISCPIQGILDDKLEIAPLSHTGHSGH